MTIITPEEKAEKVFKTLRLRLSDFVDYDPKLKTKSIVRVTPLGSGKLKGAYSYRNEIERALSG